MSELTERPHKIALQFDATIPLNRPAPLFGVLCKLNGDRRINLACTDIVKLRNNLVFWKASMSLDYTRERKETFTVQIREFTNISSIEDPEYAPPNETNFSSFPLIGETNPFSLSTLITEPITDGLRQLHLPFQEDPENDNTTNYPHLHDAVITVRGDLISEPVEYLKLGFSVRNLPQRKSYLLGSMLTYEPRPVITMSKHIYDNEGTVIPDEHVRVWRNSPPDTGYCSYVFAPLEEGIPLAVLNNGDPKKLIRFEVFDTDLSTPIGFADLPLCEILRKDAIQSFVPTTLNPDPKAFQTHKLEKSHCGYLNLTDITIERKYNFPEYVLGGLQIALTICIDFTATSQLLHEIPSPTSLAAASSPLPSSSSLFRQALEEILPVLQIYDSDKLFPTYCFGMHKCQNGRLASTEHSYPLHKVPEGLFGVKGILQAYDEFRENIGQVKPGKALSKRFAHGNCAKLFAPTFCTVLEEVKKNRCTQENQIYQVLLYFTSGKNGDDADLMNAIIASSFEPISVIIVGISSGISSGSTASAMDSGYDGFEWIEKYKAKVDPVTERKVFISHGQSKAVRDNVIFVKFNAMSKEATAKYIADQIAEQVVDYFATIKITPNLNYY